MPDAGVEPAFVQSFDILRSYPVTAVISGIRLLEVLTDEGRLKNKKI